MKIIFPHEVPVPAGVAFPHSYYYSRAQFSYHNGDGEHHAVPAAAGAVLDPKLLLVSLLPQWRMENGEDSPQQSPTLPGMRGAGLLNVAHWRWRTAMENGEEKTERCRVTSV